MILKLFADGGVIGRNPGHAVYWSVARDRDGDTEFLTERKESWEHRTNNESEYLALNEALQHASQLVGEEPEIQRVIIHQDSQLIVNQFNGRWKCGQEHLLPLLATVQRNAEWFRTSTGRDLDVVWVKRDVIKNRLGH